MNDLAPKLSQAGSEHTDCFFKLERSKCCSNFFESQCFFKRSKARSKRWTRAYFFQLFIDVLSIFTSEIVTSTSQPSIKKLEQIIENNILYEIYIENIENLKYRPREMKTIPTKLLHTKFEPEPTKTVVGPPKSLFRSQNLQLNPLTVSHRFIAKRERCHVFYICFQGL